MKVKAPETVNGRWRRTGSYTESPLAISSRSTLTSLRMA